MRFYIGTLSLVFALTAWAPLSKDDFARGDAGERAKRQEQYNVWFQSLTPERREMELQNQNERALLP